MHTDIHKSIMVTGASSTGKTTLVKAIVGRLPIARLPGDTTRAPREGEIPDFDYRYLASIEEFLENFFAKGLYLDPNIEVTRYNGNYYGSPQNWVDDVGERRKPVIFTPTSTITASKIKEMCGDQLFWVHLFTTENERCQRLLARAISKEEIAYRLSHGDSQGLNPTADSNIDTTTFDVNDVFQILINHLNKES